MKAQNVLKKVKNWQEFKEELNPLNTKDKGDAFELLTQFYLQLDPKYSTKLKSVWLLDEVPDKIKKFLNLPDTDQGIDLIAETKAGEYWTIQCKYRTNETQQTTWREVSTFAGLSFSVCKNVSFGLICTTTEKFTKVFKEQDNIGFCTSEVWSHLDEEFYKQIHKLLRKEKVKLEPFKPRTHQDKAIKSAVKHFKKAKRGKLIMPCGTGKSLTAYWIAEKLNSKTILVAVPSLALIRQTLEVWLREFSAKNKNVSWICVCSDTSVGQIERDDIMVYTQDLGIPCITDTDEIKKWFKDTPKNNYKVVFTTYQSGKVIAKASKKLKINYDLGIMDEAHKTVGQKEKLFTHLLDNKNIDIKKIMFMTATERRYAGKSDEIVSMDNPDIYGETFFDLSFKEALETKPQILSDYKIITIFVDNTEIQELIEKNIFVRPDKLDKEVEAETLASVIALRKAIQKYPIKHCVSFHTSIKRAEIFRENQELLSKRFKNYGKLDTFFVSGKTPTSVRHRILDEFSKSDNSLITNARCLTEGVDVPNIDCVLFADPKKSTIDIVQAVGRALRPAKGKEYGYIIIPVLIDKEIKENKLEKSTAFSSILSTLRALASNDERITEYFRTLAQGRKPSGKIINIDIDEKVAEKLDIEDFTNSIQLKTWGKLAKLSWRPFVDARRFVRNLKLKKEAEWRLYAKNKLKKKGNKPFDIPSNPGVVYKNKGWIGMGDWLGTGTIATQKREYLEYEEAEKFAISLNLKNVNEWWDYTKGKFKKLPPLPANIPANPHQVYKDNGWDSFGKWLNTGNISTRPAEFLTFKDAKKFVHKLNLKTKNDWKLYCQGKFKNKRPNTIPALPDRYYIDKGWKNWSDWLGSNLLSNREKSKMYMNFKKAIKFSRSLNLKSEEEWKLFVKGKIKGKPQKPVNIPQYPQQAYKNKGWKSWPNWLGKPEVEFLTFKDAKKFVHSLDLKSDKEWRLYKANKLKSKGIIPPYLPKQPQKVYRNEWKSTSDWLGTKRVATHLKEFLPFNDARKYVHSLKLKSFNDWRKYCVGRNNIKDKKPNNIPALPNRVYKTEWKGWGDWLGTNTPANYNIEFLPYNQLKIIVKEANIKTQKEYKEWYKKDKQSNIPSNPQNTYKNKGWKNWASFLGTKNIRYKEFLPYYESKAFVKKLGLKSNKEWRLYCVGKFKKAGIKPQNIPSNPQRVYKDKWVSWPDWLGKTK